mmetsp:Transcript_40883/g.47529  ORF Transcript_40883/g.47529 Transcript_40883/m.47529 type:complete len:86 (+) Transcript_40883:33-290(+)|eukprot:CAMPEP_0176446952 /NCGR_PEP_ID=MMETSP0127-20121128/24687_1 /TAXON_ID=938130 /ORGANISM="Platyophrya macrostoma, Strain WH" /LENGTH=85 /DNA_ID=CAMNT_0017833195 /DNA_START=31 /DNA_END=288 /DNA_ORIENTATION=+
MDAAQRELHISDIILNSIYRTCFKATVPKSGEFNDKKAFVNCFTKMLHSYHIVGPAVTQEYNTRKEQEPAVEGAGGEEGGEEESE